MTCYTLVHNLITDMVDGLGGSTLLIKILNRLGACSSVDTLASLGSLRGKREVQKMNAHQHHLQSCQSTT